MMGAGFLRCDEYHMEKTRQGNDILKLWVNLICLPNLVYQETATRRRKMHAIHFPPSASHHLFF
jgi:hypothetical protein